MSAWIDGEILPIKDVRISPLAHSMHYGTGVFEGVRCYAQEGGGGGAFRLRDHLERLHTSARIVGYEVPWSVEDLTRATVETLKVNEMDAGYIRPLVWLGDGGMGVAGKDNTVHTMIMVWPWGAYLGEEGLKHGIRTQITSYERPTNNASAQRAKVTGQYVTSFMAKRQAMAQGFDEALMLDRGGNVVEGTGENLFVCLDGNLVTTPDASPILLGITRDTVITLARDLDIPVCMEEFSRTDMYRAEEAFLCGTAAEITPIREVDGRPLGESPGPVTRALQETYLSLVRGIGPRASEWITPV